MQPLVMNASVLAITMLYYLWRAHDQARQRQRQVLCQRVAYMLWAVAQQIPEGEPAA